MRIGVLYEGKETLLSRGFRTGRDVQVGGYFPEKTGKVVELDPMGLPFEAKVQLSGGKTYWIKSKFLALTEADRRFWAKHGFSQPMPSSFDLALAVGDVVNVGAGYSKRMGTILRVEPGKAEVSLGKNGRGVLWIRLDNLSKRTNLQNNPLEIMCMKLANCDETNFMKYISDPKKNSLICDAILYGVKESVLSIEDTKKIAKLIYKIQYNEQENELRDSEYAQKQKQYLIPILNIIFEGLSEDCKRKTFSPLIFWLSKCFNNPTFADTVFVLNGETIHAHRFFLNLAPYIDKYQGQKIIIDDEVEAAKVKSQLKKLYCYPLTMQSLANSDDYYRGINSQYLNCDKSSALIQPTDFTFTCGTDKFHAHKVVLAQLIYFNAMFGYAGSELREFECNEKQFNEIKILLNYMYKGEIPKNEYFDQLLDFYNS